MKIRTKILCLLTPLIVAISTAVSTPARAQDARARTAKMLVRILSEEKTEINTLSAQQTAFRRMGDAESAKIAAMFGRWISDHKAVGPTLVRLIQWHGADPAGAGILKSPVLGDRMKMLTATHNDHEAAVLSSQRVYGATYSQEVRRAMRYRANLARKHLREMQPYMHKLIATTSQPSGSAPSAIEIQRQIILGGARALQQKEIRQGLGIDVEPAPTPTPAPQETPGERIKE